MRGTPRLTVDGTASGGIIPAYAGNTSSRKGYPFGLRDHPRICGEHSNVALSISTFTGSSPHMRGTLLRDMWKTVHTGIIPAYAGNTLAPDLRVRIIRDHPRICGEHSNVALSISTFTGSSPHMRGTLLAMMSATSLAGIIPAYAGNTCRMI